MRRRTTSWISAGLAGLLLGLGSAPPSAAVERVAGGVRVEFDVSNLSRAGSGGEIRSGDELRVQFRISDPQSGFAVPDLHPAAWITPRERGEEAPDAAACEAKIQMMAQLGVSRADEDLNGFYIITLGADGSLAVLNPVVSLNTANVKSITLLDGAPARFELDERSGLVYVTQPAEGQVAVVDIREGRLQGYLGVGREPRSVEVSPDGRYVWVGNDASGSVSVLASDGSAVVKTLPVGAGPIEITFDERGHFAFAAAAKAGHVAVIDVARLAVARKIPVGPGPLEVAYSALGEALYVLSLDRHEITVVHPSSGRIETRLPVGPGVTTLGATPDGRHVLALDTEQMRVLVLDAASARITRSIPVEEPPTHLLMSSIFAYVYHASSSNVSLIQLSALDDPGPAPVVRIPMGVARPEGDLIPRELLPMDILPEEGGAVVANPAEKTLYFYTEGMSAPMGSFKTYTTAPMGLRLYDRSLQERTRAGVYETTVRLDSPAIYDVPFVLPSPKHVTCFEIEVKGDRVAEALPPAVRSRFSLTTFRPGEPASLRFEIRDPEDGSLLTDLQDVRVLAFRLGTNWSRREPAAALGEGVYEARVRFPEPGSYHVLLESLSQGLHFQDLRHFHAQVEASPAEDPKPPASRSGP